MNEKHKKNSIHHA